MRQKGLLILLLFVALSAYLFQTGYFDSTLQSHDVVNNNSATLHTVPLPIKGFSSSIKLDQDAQAIIEELIADVSVPAEENSISYAIQLDHQVGRPLWVKGKYKELYPIYKKILSISYYNNSLRGIQIALGVVGDIQKNLGLKHEGLDTLLLAYKIAQLENIPSEYGVLEISIADQLSDGDKGLSLMWRLKAKEHLEGTHYVHDYVSLLTKLAQDLKFFNKNEEARELYKQAYNLSPTISSDPNIQWIRKQFHYDYVIDLISIEDYDTALAIIDEHLKLYQSDLDKSMWYFGKMHYLKAKCLKNKGLNEQAYRSYMSAYSAYEYNRSLAKGEEDRADRDNANFSVVNDLIQFNIDTGNLEQALQLLEENKARTLSDIVGEEIQKDLYQEWRTLQSRHMHEREALYQDAITGTRLGSGLALDQIPKSFDTVQYMVNYEKLIKKQRHDEFKLKLSQESQQTQVTQADEFHLIREIKPKIPSDTALISIFTDKDKVGLFILTQADTQYIQTDLSISSLTQRVREINYMIVNPYVDFYKTPTKEIYDKTFRLVEEHLDNKIKRLVISKDGYFKNLPIGILFDGTAFMDQKFIIQDLPSLRFYAPQQNIIKTDYGISCVDPDSYSRLPFQQDTSHFIQKIYGDKLSPLIGSDCAVDKLEKEIIVHNDNKLFIHLGAHGHFHYSRPLESGIWLSVKDGSTGLWNAKDIGTLNLSHVNLVSLSSKETGRNDQNRSRDIYGINRTLIYAGVKNIVSPVWDIPDYHTSLLMQNFYQNYFTQADPSKALHQAKLKMITDSKYSHPFYWGGFISTGGIH